MGGWGSNNKYALLSAMRAVNQIISYDLPFIFAALVPVRPGGLAAALRHRGGPGGPLVRHLLSRHRPARLPRLHRGHPRRREPRALRHPRGGVRAGRGLPRRVLGHEVRPDPARRVRPRDRAPRSWARSSSSARGRGRGRTWLGPLWFLAQGDVHLPRWSRGCAGASCASASTRSSPSPGSSCCPPPSLLLMATAVVVALQEAPGALRRARRGLLGRRRRPVLGGAAGPCASRFINLVPQAGDGALSGRDARTIPTASAACSRSTYDKETGEENCIGCRLCEYICPPQVIKVEMLKAEKRNFAKTFTLELYACEFCELCVQVCPTDAIIMMKSFDVATRGPPRAPARQGPPAPDRAAVRALVGDRQPAARHADAAQGAEGGGRRPPRPAETRARVSLEPIAFGALAVVLLASSLAVVLTKNLFHSVLYLALSLTGDRGHLPHARRGVPRRRPAPALRGRRGHHRRLRHRGHRAAGGRPHHADEPSARERRHRRGGAAGGAARVRARGARCPSPRPP